jgi:REP element-mobilizing transposase RayT
MNSDNHPFRKSLRLPNYDYSQAGAYFVTICTADKISLFGDIVEGEMQLNELGKIVREELLQTGKMRPNVDLDSFVIMPNHLHMILFFHETEDGNKSNLGSVIRGIKATTNRRVNEARHTTKAAVWQRNYFERVVRNDDELAKIRQYIESNPLKWELDSENPLRIAK